MCELFYTRTYIIRNLTSKEINRPNHEEAYIYSKLLDHDQMFYSAGQTHILAKPNSMNASLQKLKEPLN